MKNFTVVALLICALSVFSVSCTSNSPVEAGNVTLSWDAPTKYFDGSPLPASDIGFYTLYWGSVAGGPYPNKLNVGKVLTTAVPNLTTGTYYFVATCTTTTAAGSQESGNSNQVVKQAVGVPNSPANLQ